MEYLTVNNYTVRQHRIVIEVTSIATGRTIKHRLYSCNKMQKTCI